MARKASRNRTDAALFSGHPDPLRVRSEEAGVMAKNTQSQSGTDRTAKEQMAKGMAEAGKDEIGKAGKKGTTKAGKPGTHDLVEGMSEAGRQPHRPRRDRPRPRRAVIRTENRSGAPAASVVRVAPGHQSAGR